MAKSEILMSIGEVARSIEVSRRMILYYEERGLITPDVKEEPNGNRYYTPDTLSRIRTIRILSDIGLSLDEVKSYYDDKTDLRPMLARLEVFRDELNLSIEKLRERVDGGSQAGIVYTTLPKQTVFCKVVRTSGLEKKKETLRIVSTEAMRKYGSDTSKRMYFLEHPLDDPTNIAYCVAVPEGNRGEYLRALPEVRAIMITHHGAYEELPEVKARLLNYASAEGLKPLGVCRHIFLEGPPQHKDPGKFITQVVVPIA